MLHRQGDLEQISHNSFEGLLNLGDGLVTYSPVAGLTDSLNTTELLHTSPYCVELCLGWSWVLDEWYCFES